MIHRFCLVWAGLSDDCRKRHAAQTVLRSLTVNWRGPKSSSNELLSSRPIPVLTDLQARHQEFAALGNVGYFFFARSCNALNFSFWAMPLLHQGDITTDSAGISNPTVARLCWDSPGQARINGVSFRAVSSLPRTPNAVNAQLFRRRASGLPCGGTDPRQIQPVRVGGTASFTCTIPGYSAFRREAEHFTEVEECAIRQ